MDIFQALRTRRSIRKYTNEPVNDAHLRQILEIAMLAPSARNEQPWQFVVIRDAGTRAKIAKTSPYTHMAADAPLVIIVCGDLREDKAENMWVQDCAAATENILLAARGLELGSVWCGVHPVKEREEHCRAVLGLPQEIIPFALICIGHPAQKFSELDRYNPERVHLDNWGKVWKP